MEREKKEGVEDLNLGLARFNIGGTTFYDESWGGRGGGSVQLYKVSNKFLFNKKLNEKI